MTIYTPERRAWAALRSFLNLARLSDSLGLSRNAAARWSSVPEKYVGMVSSLTGIPRTVLRPSLWADDLNGDEHMDVFKVAKICHEANRAYCAALGDHSQLPWEDAPAWQRDSAVKGVKFIRENPAAGAAASHESWLKQKTEEGWKYGPKKDPEAKEHPCFVPYDELPTEQKAKDYIFGAIVRAAL